MYYWKDWRNPPTKKASLLFHVIDLFVRQQTSKPLDEYPVSRKIIRIDIPDELGEKLVTSIDLYTRYEVGRYSEVRKEIQHLMTLSDPHEIVERFYSLVAKYAFMKAMRADDK
ncbi:MAG: hypothetical protein QXP93_05590 [Nitrososphaerota archaeon]